MSIENQGFKHGLTLIESVGAFAHDVFFNDFQNAAPSNALGQNGDRAVDISTLEIWQKQAGTWQLTGLSQRVSSEAGKGGTVPPGSFSGTPKKYTVVFSSPFPDTQYSAVVTGGDLRAWSIENKTAGGFMINSNANAALTADTNWVALVNGG